MGIENSKKMAKTVKHKDLKSFFGEQDHLEVSQNKSFAQMIFELLSEKEPTQEQINVFELILNLSIDHGSDTPSSAKVVEEAKKGEDISESVSEGIEQINDRHGGAGENLMKVFYRVKRQESSVQEEVQVVLEKVERMPGFGHRIYKDVDPRALLILSQPGINQEFIEIAKEMEKELEKQSGKHLPLNIDGAIAVVLCSFGWEPILGKAIFIIARTPGLVGQYLNAIA